MAKSNRKKMGRPLLGDRPSQTVAVRLDPEAIELLDSWALARAITRSQAARQLINQGLKGSGKK